MTAPPRVQVDWRQPGKRKPEGVVLCSRPSRWGNPWKVSFASEIGRYVVTRWNGCRGRWDNYRFRTMGQTETMMICLELYRRYLRMRLRRNPAFLEPLRTATGLACYCKLDAACHVDVIREFLEGTNDQT